MSKKHSSSRLTGEKKRMKNQKLRKKEKRIMGLFSLGERPIRPHKTVKSPKNSPPTVKIGKINRRCSPHPYTPIETLF